MLLNTEPVARMQIDRHCRQLGVAPRIAIEVNSMSAIVEVAREQTGLFPVPLEFAGLRCACARDGLGPMNVMA